MTRRTAWPLLAAAVAGCGGGPRPGAPAPPRAAPATVTDGGRIAVLEEPNASAVAAALVFPGSGWELPGTEGLTLLSAETLLETARPGLERLEATATVQCDRAAFTVTLVAPVVHGPRALDLLLDALFEPRPTQGALDSARARLRRILTLDNANPSWQARLAARQALHGDTIAPSPWSGPGCGVPEILARFDLAHIRAGAYRFAPRMARAALLAPEAVEGLRERIHARLPLDEAPPPLPAPRSTRPGRRYVERNTVTAWTSLAFPFDTAADPEAILGLAALIEETFGPGIDRPDVFAVSHELEQHGRGGALIVHMVTTPASATRFADTVVGWVAGFGDGGATGSWDRVAARYRGTRLLARERPESRAAAMALAMALAEHPGGGWPEPRLTEERVRDAAAALGSPARSVVGPRAARPAAP